MWPINMQRSRTNLPPLKVRSRRDDGRGDVKNLPVGHQFLCKHASGGDHGETAVIDLFVLQLLKLFWIRRFEVKRIEA